MDDEDLDVGPGMMTVTYCLLIHGNSIKELDNAPTVCVASIHELWGVSAAIVGGHTLEFASYQAFLTKFWIPPLPSFTRVLYRVQRLLLLSQLTVGWDGFAG